VGGGSTGDKAHSGARVGPCLMCLGPVLTEQLQQLARGGGVQFPSVVLKAAMRG